MSWKLISLLLVLGGVIRPVVARAEENGRSKLDGFYVVREAISDASPFWFKYILEVSPDKDGATVRYIRIAPLNSWCRHAITLKAAVVHLRGRSPRDLVGAGNPCVVTHDDFERVIENSRVAHMEGLFDSALWNVVARCGNTEKVFHFPYPERVDLDRLKKRSPRVKALWNLESKIVKKAFGKKSVFYDIPHDRDLELQRLGVELLPELRSGRYDKGFHDYCSDSRTGSGTSQGSIGAPAQPCSRQPLASLLRDYREPLLSQEPIPQLVNADELHFLKFELPNYPPLAKLASIQGQVVLNVKFDQESGDAKDVTILSGHPLLAKSAQAAALRWKLDPKAQTANPMRVVLNYAFNCP